MRDLSSPSMSSSTGVLHPALKSMKRTIRNKREFIGWASTSLIEFLISIHKDPSKTCSLIHVNNIINDYITKNQLTDPKKKKRVVCDERLLSIFGKRTVNRTKLLDLLEQHLLEYQDSPEEDEFSDNMEKGESVSNSCKRKRNMGLDKTNATVGVKEAPRSCFASIVTQNIKLVYLKKSLIQKLLEEINTFNEKVVGSFVRVKSDPNDYLQKYSHQLLQVTGIQKASETGDSSTGILLQLSNRSDGVHIRELSDDYFTEEECEDLNRRVKDGQVKRLTTWELEGKARVLHQDITYHWIEKELALLQNLIDRANEKGWHRERYEYLERRELLESSSERERLIQEVPQVIADEFEVESPAQFPGDEIAVLKEEQNQLLSKSIEEQQASIVQYKQCLNNQTVNEDHGQDIEVIDIDDSDDDVDGNAYGNLILDHPESSIWYYLDPSGKVQGPFSMSSLKVLKDRDFFKSDCRVWKTGQTSDAAILLTDAISQVFTNKW